MTFFMKKISNLFEGMKNHLVDTTAILVQSTPVYGLVETLTGMPNDISLNSRLVAAGTFYAGMGKIWTAGRELSAKLFKVGKKSSERAIALHDAAYSLAYNSAFCPAMYLIAGSRDCKEIVFATVASGLMGLVNGAPQGYAVDVTRDLTGLERCDRTTYPDFIRKKSSTVKKGIFAVAAAASIGLMGLIYVATPDEGLWKSNQEPSKIERKIDSDNK